MSAPSYDATTTPLATSDVKDTIESTLTSSKPVELSDANLKAAHEAIAKELNSSKMRDQIKEDVAALAGTAARLEEDFATIGCQVERVDKRNIFPTQFAPKWNEYHAEYSALLTISQSTATDATVQIDRFLEVIFPVLTQKTEEERNYLLDDFIRDISAVQAEATDAEQGFKKLKEGVNKFRFELNNAVKDEMGEVKEEIAACEERINQLRTDLEKTSGFFRSCWETLKLSGPPSVPGSSLVKYYAGGVAGAEVPIAATAALAALAPRAGVAILGAGVGGLIGGYQKQARNKADLKDELDGSMQILKSLGDKQQELVQTAHEISMLNNTFNGMVNRLAAIQGIWKMMKTDAQRLKAYSKYAKDDTDTKLPYTLGLMESVYRSLHTALDNYALNIRVSSS